MKLLQYYEARRPRSYETSWHHRWMCEVIERSYTERKNSIIEVPPRHGKSEVCNVYGPSWRLDSHHDAKFGLVTNSDTLAAKFSTACRNLASSPLSVDRDRQWKLASADESLDFSYLSAGIRGQITGFGFDTVTFDDLLKSGADAKSDAVRENVWENVVSAALNRLTPDGIVVALQARLHHSDVIGKLLELDSMKFLHLHLPATNDGDGAFFRDGYAGTEERFPSYSALWPTRYSRKRLDEIKATVTPYYWNAQFQQVPSMGELGYFDVGIMPTYPHTGCERCWIAVDAAQTETARGSYTAFVCLGLFGNGLKVLGVLMGRWRQDVMNDKLVEFYLSMARLTGIFPERIVVEKAAGGYGIIDHLSGQLPIEAIYPAGSKEDRAGAVCYIVNRGQVSLPEAAPWLKAFKEEVQNFPLASAKDQVDAFVHALSYALRPSEFKPEPVHAVAVYDPQDEFPQDEGWDNFPADHWDSGTPLFCEEPSPALQRALARLRGR